MVKRVLVTTALEDTWPKDGSAILFLGEWCKLYGRKHVWQNLDYEVVPYHWNDRAKLYEDYENLLVYYENALTVLAKKLNEIHGVNHSLRYWRILLGPWLGYFIQMLFDRWFMLAEAFRHFDISNCSVRINEPFESVPSDMDDFIHRFTDDDWNEVIYEELLAKFFSGNIKVNKIHTRKRNPLISQEACDPVFDFKATFLFFREAIKRSSSFFSKTIPTTTRYFFIGTYLPKKIEFLLQILLGQVPKFFFSPKLSNKPVEREKRKWHLELKDTYSGHAEFNKILAYMIPRHIPTVYLEGYLSLEGEGVQNGWPKQPEIIFTSNAYSSDDFFKAWAAKSAENGSKLIIGQHGGHFGMTPFAFHEEHQIKIADRWISWGWADESCPKVSALGNFKDAGKPPLKSEKTGAALLVQFTIPRYSYHLYAVPISACQYNDYFEDQLRFVTELKTEIQQQLIIRLYSHDYNIDQSSRWRDAFPDARIDNGRKRLTDLLVKSRIYISTYNATTYLESLAQNFPTLIYWNPEHWELRHEVEPYFNLLESAGIFHKTPESAAKKLNEIWYDVEGWWLDPITQGAKDLFCAKYTKKIDRPVSKLASVIRGL